MGSENHRPLTSAATAANATPEMNRSKILCECDADALTETQLCCSTVDIGSEVNLFKRVLHRQTPYHQKKLLLATQRYNIKKYL